MGSNLDQDICNSINIYYEAIGNKNESLEVAKK